jgi:hypothetical protein
MQHRQLRLGDILDDYCPRERRITNHAVVAMVDQEVKRTRCTTCDTEHEYKQAKVPTTRRKKQTPSALVKEALAGAPQPPVVAEPDEQALLRRRGATAPPPEEPVVTQAAPAPEPEGQEAAELQAEAAELQAEADGPDGQESEDDGPVHRRLIRATLPRPEGPVARPTPQFTLRQQGGRGGNFPGGKPRTPPRHRGSHASTGRPSGNGAMTARPAFGRGAGRDPFATRSTGRPDHPRAPRHAHAGRPRDGKKHSK